MEVREPRCLKVALLSTERRWHGGEEQARLLLHGLVSRGHRCQVLARGDGRFAERCAAEGFAVTRFAGRGRSPRSLWRMRRSLQRFRPDVIHFNDAAALTGGGPASWGLSAVRVAARRVDFPPRRTWHYRTWTDGLICVSHDVARVCRDAGLPGGMLAVVHDGVDPRRFRDACGRRGRQSLGLPANRPLLLTVAKLTDHKGHRTLLDALPRIVDRRPDAQLVMAGDGELRTALAEQARQLGIRRNVRLLGYRDDIPDLLQAADLLVHPSHLEGLGSTLIDAMLSETAIVATTAGGIPDLLSAEAGVPPLGWLVEPRDAEGLTAAILDALGDPQQRAHRAADARARAERQFTHDCMVVRTELAYRDRWRRKFLPASTPVGRAATAPQRRRWLPIR